MLEKSNAEIQLGGLKILNAVPSDESFAILAKQPPSQNEDVNRQIHNSLEVYALQINDLPILERAVLSENPVIQKQAALLIQDSATNHLLLPKSRARRADNAAPASAPPVDTYRKAVLVLTSASQNAKDQEAKTAIDQSLANIQNMIQRLSPSA
jgi:hypothetical protein